MSKRTEKRIGELSVNESVKHPIPTETKTYLLIYLMLTRKLKN